MNFSFKSNITLSSILLASSMFVLAPVVDADTIYKWRDSDGRTHFTNREANIPIEYRNVEKKKMPPTATVIRAKKEELRETAYGKTIWDNNCARCHAIGENSAESSLRGLPSHMINASMDVQSLAAALEESLKLREVDMEFITLNAKELQAISKYIIKASTK